MSQTPGGRDSEGRFQPGASGNPSGRHRAIREALEAFRDTDDLAYLKARLLDLAGDSDGKVACAAIKEWHDRAYGRPPMAVTGPDGGPLVVATGDILTVLEALAKGA